ncbi:MAG: thioesterase family protein [Sphingomonadaceae bacterium]|nr:thioesterase family protein [Sphingomonadaceae bacterium]
MSLPALFTAARRDGDDLVVTLGTEWMQGRTSYGGASAAIALAAAKAAHPDLPPLRSAQIAFVGPLGGEARATPVLLRRGKNSAFVGCDVTGGEGVGLRALFLFMASRESEISHADLMSPAIDGPEGNLIDPERLPQGFLTNFDLSVWTQEGATIRRWARLGERDGLIPDVELLAIADALPPAAMSLAKQWGPISTTTWQLNLVTDAIATRDGWWLLEAKALHAGHGSSSQTMTIWNRDLEPVATATQSVALFV